MRIIGWEGFQLNVSHHEDPWGCLSGKTTRKPAQVSLGGIDGKMLSAMMFRLKNMILRFILRREFAVWNVLSWPRGYQLEEALGGDPKTREQASRGALKDGGA